METSNRQVTSKMRAEAAAWIARLHGPQRNRRTEAGFKTWLRADAAHTDAFEQVTDAWEAIGSVPSERLSSMVRWERVGEPRRRVHGIALAAAAGIAALAIGVLLFNRDGSPLATSIGEQRVVSLEDGSRVYLNTASRLSVRYDRQMRRVELEEGEALFEVAKHSNWPFVVGAGSQEIMALGTSFVVQRDENRLSVTLVEGKVAVTPVEGLGEMGTRAGVAPRTLEPGQRLVLETGRAPAVDRPVVERVTAWKRGLVILDAMRLAEAVAEMNRYSAVPLEVTDARAAGLRVSGAFRAGDSLSFARAVAVTYRLDVLDRHDKIVLSGAPRPTYP